MDRDVPTPRPDMPGRETALLAGVISGRRPAPGEQAPWRAQWDLARMNGVLVLFSEAVLRDPDQPDSHKDLARGVLRQAAAREVWHAQELRQVLDTLAGKGISCLLLKGGGLAHILYGEPHWRERADTDLLFAHRDQALAAWNLIASLGYERGRDTDAAQASAEFYCTRRQGPLCHMLDIHWRPCNTPVFGQLFSFDELMDQALALPGLGRHARTPSLVHALALALAHRMAHAMEKTADRLVWLYDIHLLCQALDREQWREFILLCRERGLQGTALHGLERAAFLFATSLPEGILQDLAAGARSETFRPEQAASPLAMARMELASLPSYRARFRYIREHLFPPPAYMRDKYGPCSTLILPLCYLHRIGSGFTRRLRASLK